jgi:hypothetical protein
VGPPVVTKKQIAMLHRSRRAASSSTATRSSVFLAGSTSPRSRERWSPSPSRPRPPLLKAIKYVVNNSDLGGDLPNGGLELSLYYDPNEEEYVARMSAGEFSGHSTAPTFELLLLSLPWVTEDTGAVCVGADGQLLCVGCEGSGLYGDESICEDCNGRKIDWRDVNVTKDDAYP